MKKSGILLLLSVILLLSGCKAEAPPETEIDKTPEVGIEEETETETALDPEYEDKYQKNIGGSDMNLDQLKKPQVGEEVAVIKTNHGDIKIRLFPEAAPKTVENFKTHAQNGYYDGVTFHRVMKDFMIQGGDPNGTGSGGESIWGGSFEDEFSPDHHNLRGALSMANAGPNTNGSQFFIVHKSNIEPGSLSEDQYSPDSLKAYEELGGTPWLDYGHTVFGQVIEGMDIVDEIANVPTGGNDKPKEDVIMEKIEIVEYK